VHGLEELDSAWNRAYQTNDYAVLERIFASEWVGFLADGSSIERTAFLDGLPHNPPATLEFSEFSMRDFGETGVTRGRVDIRGADFEISQRFVRVWARRHGAWQAVAVQVVPI
jgi:Domain of unknown function (DUF4440)